MDAPRAPIPPPTAEGGVGGGVDASGSAATTGCDGVVAAAAAAPALADAARACQVGTVAVTVAAAAPVGCLSCQR